MFFYIRRTVFSFQFISKYLADHYWITHLDIKKSTVKPYFTVLSLMRMVGLEPTRCHHRQILSLLRLPFRHIRVLEYNSTGYYKNQAFFLINYVLVVTYDLLCCLSPHIPLRLSAKYSSYAFSKI